MIFELLREKKTGGEKILPRKIYTPVSWYKTCFAYIYKCLPVIGSRPEAPTAPHGPAPPAKAEAGLIAVAPLLRTTGLHVGLLGRGFKHLYVPNWEKKLVF